jgi:hypothetical protein
MSEELNNPQFSPTQTEEIRISDLIVNLREYVHYLVKRWWVFIIMGIIGSGAGFAYAMFQDEDYITEATYIIDSNSGSSSVMSSLMAVAGAFGMSSSSSSEGFSNELLHGIINSRRVIKGAMLQEYMIEGSYGKLGNHLVTIYPDWADEQEIQGRVLVQDSLSLVDAAEDSLLELMYLKIKEDHMSVVFDEGLALNTVTFRSISRDFSINFTDFIIKDASDFFIASAISKEKSSLDVASHQADSLMDVLKGKERRLASLSDSRGYNFQAVSLLEQGRLLRDVEVMSTMYAESYASLEMARTNLRDKKPIIEVVDEPKYATYKEEIKLVALAIIAGIITAFLTIIFFILKKLIADILREEEAYVEDDLEPALAGGGSSTDEVEGVQDY